MLVSVAMSGDNRVFCASRSLPKMFVYIRLAARDRLPALSAKLRCCGVDKIAVFVAARRG